MAIPPLFNARQNELQKMLSKSMSLSPVLVRISESSIPNERQCLDHADRPILAAVSIVTLAFGFAVCLSGLKADEEVEGDEEDHAADGCECVREEDRVCLHGGEGVGSEDWLEEEECVCGRHGDDGEVFTEMRILEEGRRICGTRWLEVMMMVLARP